MRLPQVTGQRIRKSCSRASGLDRSSNAVERHGQAARSTTATETDRITRPSNLETA